MVVYLFSYLVTYSTDMELCCNQCKIVTLLYLLLFSVVMIDCLLSLIKIHNIFSIIGVVIVNFVSGRFFIEILQIFVVIRIALWR